MKKASYCNLIGDLYLFYGNSRCFSSGIYRRCTGGCVFRRDFRGKLKCHGEQSGRAYRGRSAEVYGGEGGCRREKKRRGSQKKRRRRNAVRQGKQNGKRRKQSVKQKKSVRQNVRRLWISLCSLKEIRMCMAVPA